MRRRAREDQDRLIRELRRTVSRLGADRIDERARLLSENDRLRAQVRERDEWIAAICEWHATN